MLPTDSRRIQQHLCHSATGLLRVHDLVDDADFERTLDAAGDHLMLRSEFKFNLLAILVGDL